ncbi:MAG: TIGR02147 family protein [Bdellovibrio sp.]
MNKKAVALKLIDENDTVASPQPQVLPTIFEYDNYRKYIKDYYQFAKGKNKNFSHRLFSRLAGFKSSNFIKLIIDGKSNVSPESAESLAKAMKLGKEESLFFQVLVRFNQAKDTRERHHLAQELLKFRTYRKIFPLNEALFNYTAKWYLSILRGLVGLPGFKEDPKWLSTLFEPAVTPSEIEKGLEELCLMQLLTRDENGKLIQTFANVASANEVTLSSVAQFHREMMARASESIDRIPREKRDISGITIGMTVETAKKIKTAIQEFRNQIIQIASEDKNGDQIYQLNIQLFPVVDIGERQNKADKESA